MHQFASSSNPSYWQAGENERDHHLMTSDPVVTVTGARCACGFEAGGYGDEVNPYRAFPIVAPFTIVRAWRFNYSASDPHSAHYPTAACDGRAGMHITMEPA